MTPRTIATSGCYLVATVLAVGAITAEPGQGGGLYLFGACCFALLGVSTGTKGGRL